MCFGNHEAMLIARKPDIAVRQPVHVHLEATIVIEVDIGNENCEVIHLFHHIPNHEILYIMRNQEFTRLPHLQNYFLISYYSQHSSKRHARLNSDSKQQHIFYPKYLASTVDSKSIRM